MIHLTDLLRWDLSFALRYFFVSNIFSITKICLPVKVVRIFLLLCAWCLVSVSEPGDKGPEVRGFSLRWAASNLSSLVTEAASLYLSGRRISTMKCGVNLWSRWHFPSCVSVSVPIVSIFQYQEICNNFNRMFTCAMFYSNWSTLVRTPEKRAAMARVRAARGETRGRRSSLTPWTHEYHYWLGD